MGNNTVFALLAGGKSQRMGTAKGLLKYQESFWILEQLKRISKTSIQEVYIGLGYNYNLYFEAIPWFEKATASFENFNGLNVKVILNTMPELGSFSTLQTILKEIDTTKNVLVNPIDIPLLNSEELIQLIEMTGEIVFPNFEGKNGHPVKMTSSFWKTLVALDLTSEEARLDVQLKKVNPAKISILEVLDRVILYNLNTKSNWNLYLKEVL